MITNSKSKESEKFNRLMISNSMSKLLEGSLEQTETQTLISRI
jgi:hypothetical protein